MSDLEALRAALGGDAVVEHEPAAVDGVSLTATLRPGSGEELAAGLRVLSERGMAALVCGGRSRLGQANLLRRADLALELGGLDGVLELDAEDGAARVLAGTRIASLRESARAAGWELPLDPPGEAATVGGAIASAAEGPRFGHPRSIVLGLEMASPSGARTRCGGRVVKNVTGFDLVKLYTGSFGSLSVIEAAWLRLRPLPERTLTLAATLPEGVAGYRRALEAARRPSARFAAHLSTALAPAVDPGFAGEGDVLLLELAGHESALRADRDQLGREIGAREVDGALIERLRKLQGSTLHEGGIRFRLGSLPSRIGEVAARLAQDGGAALAFPGRGLLYAHFPLQPAEDRAAVERATRSAELAATAGGGHFAIEDAPHWAKRDRDVFAAPRALVPIFRALKRQYDPAGVLNPGRFAGCL